MISVGGGDGDGGGVGVESGGPGGDDAFRGLWVSAGSMNEAEGEAEWSFQNHASLKISSGVR